MSKKKNYYQVHKNKKPKAKINKINWDSIYKVTISATELVNSIVQLRNSMHDFYKIKGYKEFREQLAISRNIENTGGIITGENNTEYFLSANGEKFRVQPPIDFRNHSVDNFNTELKRRMNSASITSDELIKRNKLFIEHMKSVTTLINSLINKKAPN